VRDKRFLAWLHDGLPCLSCLILTGASHNRNIEAAHVKIGIASRGWTECGRGVRPHDARSIPLCSHCHRLAPDACDVNQRQFFDRLGLGDEIADLSDDLYAAYQRGQDGAAVIRRWARR
jgi:hypothetical protein